MDLQKFGKLYIDLFNIAWNEKYSLKNIRSCEIGVELFNGYKIEQNYDGWINTSLFYWKPVIRISKSRKEYECSNNSEHIIKRNEKYSRLILNQDSRTNEILCLSCISKIL